MERTTEINEGKIKCSLCGEMTGIDCRCMQDDPCKGYFIFDSTSAVELDSISINTAKEVN